MFAVGQVVLDIGGPNREVAEYQYVDINPDSPYRASQLCNL
jgi:hypothetical protein